MPIDGTPTSNQQAAAAGTGGVLSTGFDRKVNKEKISDDIDAPPKPQFKNALIEVIDSSEVGEVNVKRERKPHEEELLYAQELKRLSDFKLDSVVSKKKEDKKKLKKTEEPMAAEEAPSRLEEFIPSGERVKRIEEELLREYVSLNAKLLTRHPLDELDRVEIRLNELKTQFFEAGFKPEDFNYLDQKTIDMIRETLLHVVKDKFFKSLDSQMDAVKWIINSKSGKTIAQFLNLLETDSVGLSERAKVLSNLEISDLAEISDHFHIDLDSLMKSFNKSTVAFDRTKGLDAFFHAMRSPSLKELSPVADKYRNSRTELLMEDSFIKRFGMRSEVNKLNGDLLRHGMAKADIKNIDEQSRRMAWLKTITLLKVHHIKRILTTSSDEFDKESDNIEKLMRKSEKLGHDIPKEGVKWIEQSLVKMSFETATYKLELLRSLQKIGFDEEREKDITHLTQKLNELSKKLAVSAKPH